LQSDKYPTVYTEVALEFIVKGEGVDPAAVERAVGIADERLCSVWVMLKDGTPISTSYRVVKEQRELSRRMPGNERGGPSRSPIQARNGGGTLSARAEAGRRSRLP
jgi:hypothetical protein